MLSPNLAQHERQHFSDAEECSVASLEVCNSCATAPSGEHLVNKLYMMNGHLLESCGLGLNQRLQPVSDQSRLTAPAPKLVQYVNESVVTRKMSDISGSTRPSVKWKEHSDLLCNNNISEEDNQQKEVHGQMVTIAALRPQKELFGCREVGDSECESSVVGPPSLRQQAYYAVPGAFRMRFSGGQVAPDCDATTSSSIRSSADRQQQSEDFIVEASLVEDAGNRNMASALDEPISCSFPASTSSAPAVFSAVDYVTVANSAASPLVEALPMDEGQAIRAFFQSKKVQFALCVLASIFAVLVVGTAYGVTGFGKITSTHSDKGNSDNTASASAPSSMGAAFVPTMSPTSAGDLGLVYFQSILPLDTQQELKKLDSAPSKALSWLQNNTMLESYSLRQRLQRFALATIFLSTGGDKRWFNSTGWLSNSDECGWFMTPLVQESSLTTEPCTGGDYIRLLLHDNGLRGTLPPEVGLLSTLQSLDVARNLLTGYLPSTIGQLTHLTEIVLSKYRLPH